MSTVKHISESKKLNDIKTLNEIYVSYFFIYLTLSLIIAVILFAYFYLFLYGSNALKNNHGINLTHLFLILCTSFELRYIGNYFKNVFEGFAEFIILNKILISTNLLYLVFVIVVYIFKLSLIHLAIFVLIGNIIFLILLILMIIFYIKVLKFNLKYFSLQLIRNHFTYGLNIQLSFFVASFIEPLIKYLLGNILSLSYVTFYEIGKRIIDLTNGIIASAQKGIFNKLSEENAIGELTLFINDKLFLYSKISNYYTIVIYGVLNSFLCYFTLIWFKSFESMLILLIFMLPYSLINFAGCIHMVIMVEGKGFKLLLLQIINLILITSFLYLSLTISHNYLGIIGYYLATIINVTLIFIFLKLYNKMEVIKFLRNIKIFDIIYLNILIIILIVVIIIFHPYLNYILLASTFVSLLLYHNQIISVYQNMKKEIILMFSK